MNPDTRDMHIAVRVLIYSELSFILCDLSEKPC